MDRRGFVRIAGGGWLAAAGIAGAGCSDRLPPASVEAWRGPRPEVEVRRWAIAHALLAPSSHNRQPWIVDLREPDAISLHVDRQRLLPQTDPWYRQIVVSQGTFLELLVLALQARGLDPQVQLFPQGEFAPRLLDDRPVARIAWKAGAPARQPDPLFAQALRRRTAKIDYDITRPIAPALLPQLGASLPPGEVRFAATLEPQRVEQLRQLCWESARVELTTPRTVMESIRLTRVGPAEIARERDGIALNQPIVRMLDAVGLFDRSRPPQPDSAAYRQMMDRFANHSRTAMGFVWLSTPVVPGRTRSAEVNAGRAYLRLQLQATALGLQMHPMSQAPQEFAEMAPHYERLHQLLLGRPAGEETVQMFCRIGYCAEVEPTPRRPLESIVRT